MVSHGLDEEAIFTVARAIASSEATAIYLQQVCGDDRDLRDRVSALLRVHEEQPEFLESPAASINAVETSHTEAVGSFIGSYKLLQELGEGGMGVVFVAEQKDPVQRHVALKLIRPGMDSRQVIARFEAERQALALMEHPGIAKVLDAGTTDSGRPFFVMELVRGVPINEYCDQHQLTPRERLQLFVQVCHAVQHAHQKGVIHRDLKPSNVLVAEYDEQAVAKIIDFGVVKAVGQPLTEKTMFTQVGQLVGTIDYMSPEQAKLNQLDVDTRTDVYSLGVLLYELLAGETPFERKRLQSAALDERLRIIREEDPPRPSTRLNSSGSLVSIAAQRQTEPKRLAILVRGELDWIVMKALEKDRSRRYQTSHALAMDIQRYLTDEPVLACPPSALYRIHKFSRRNKTVAMTSVLVTIALLVGTLASVWQAIRATRAEQKAQTARLAESSARQIAEIERNAAETQREQAKENLTLARAAVDESFTLVSESKLLEVPGLQLLRKDLIEAALRFYQGFALKHSDDPRGMADVAASHLRMAQILTAIDRNDDATIAVKEALDIIDRLRSEYPDDRESQVRLAGFFTERRWSQRGTEIPRDRLMAFQTLTRLERLWEQLAEQHPSESGFQSDLLGIYSTIGATLHWSGREKEGTPYFRKSISIGEHLVRDDPTDTRYRSAFADANLQLSKNLSTCGFYDEALALARRSTELHQELVAEFPLIPAYQVGLVTSLVEVGNRTVKEQSQQAEQAYRDAFELAQVLVDKYPGHILYLENWTTAGVQLATLQCKQGEHAESGIVMRRMTQVLQSLVTSNFDDAKTRKGLAFTCFYVASRVPNLPNQTDISEEFYRSALTMFTKLADDFPEVQTYREHTGHCHQHLGWLTLQSRRLDESLEHYRRAISLFESRSASRSSDAFFARFVSGAYRSLSEVLDLQDRPLDAFDAACTSMQLNPADSVYAIRLVEVLNEISDGTRREKALALLSPLLDAEPTDAAGWELRGRIHAAMGRVERAVSDFEKAIDNSEDGGWTLVPRKLVARNLSQSSDVFDQIAKSRPNETALWIGRGQVHALRGHWQQAMDDYAKVIDVRPIGDETFEYAALLLMANDRTRYNEFCRNLVARIGDPRGMDAYFLAHVCAIGPADGIDPTQVVKWASQEIANPTPWKLTVLALAELRAGQFELAAEHFQRSCELPDCKYLSVSNAFGFAIANFRLGRMDVARESLEKGRLLFQRAQPTRPGGAALPASPSEWLEQQLLSREAEALLRTSVKSDE